MLIPGVKKLVLLSLFLVVSCTVNDSHEAQQQSSALQAFPATFTTGEDVLLIFPKNHPLNMAIRSPSGAWYSVQNRDDKILIRPTEIYNSATELTLKTHELVGIAWINGVRVEEKIFIEYGEYLIYMADNLETEPENTFHFMTKIKLNK